jgi:hypothetical protein
MRDFKPLPERRRAATRGAAGHVMRRVGEPAKALDVAGCNKAVVL